MNLSTFRQQLHEELTENILPFAMRHGVDWEQGGFYGRLSNKNVPDPHAPKGQIQHSRQLWSFAHAYRRLGEAAYLQLANHANRFLELFWDEKNGGLFAELDSQGRPFSTLKLTYGHAFALYGYAEYVLATKEPSALERAKAIHALLQTHAKDWRHGGYFEAFRADWNRDETQNVDQASGIVGKTMNTHLHLLEAYTTFAQACPEAPIFAALRELILLTLEKIVAGAQFRLHFTDAWQPLHERCSYGHDIEGSWLLVEAAEVLGDADLLARCRQTAVLMAENVLANGRFPDGSLRESDTETVREWWPQAEALVGFWNAYQLTDDDRFLQATLDCWQFIRQRQRDHQHGEWFWAVDEDGVPQPHEKAGLWKTPYHNGRSCLELLHRLERIPA